VALEPRPGGGWVENLIRPVLVAGMTVCIGAPLVRVLEKLVPGWDGSILLTFAFLAALEGILAERLLQRRRITGWAYLGSRAAELLFLLLALKLLNYIPLGLGQLLVDAARWPLDPESFLSDLDLLTGLLFVPLWIGAVYAGRMVAEIELDLGRTTPPPADRNSPEYYMWLTQPSIVRDRQERLDRLGELFLWGGMVLLVGATLIHVFVSSARALGAPILLYFALGVALLSQAQFSVKNASWQVQGIPVQPGMARRWLLAALVFLAGVALVALILPSSYALGPFRAMWAALNLLIQLLAFVFALLFFLFMALLSLVLPRPVATQPVLPRFAPVPPPVPGSEATSFPWLEVLASALFWIVILVIVGYALLRFIRERWPGWEGGEGERGSRWQRLVAWLRELWRRWWGWQSGARQQWARRRAEAATEAPGRRPGRTFSLRGLEPRELVRYFYVSAARRAAQAGQPRRPAQTPYEYEATLGEQFPDLEPDLSGLTEAFVEARYGRELMQAEDVERVKPLWQRIKAALRRRRDSSLRSG
jgi:hypothetical protein